MNVLVQKNRSEDSITVHLSLLCLWKHFPLKKLGKNKYEKIKYHLTEILLRIWQVQGRAAETIQEVEAHFSSGGLRRQRPSVMKKELIKRNKNCLKDEVEDF